MAANLSIQLNGKLHHVSNLKGPSNLAMILEALELKTDRIAVEQNGQIIPRSAWLNTAVNEGDRLEIVHFVGGGTLLLTA
jgi:thiamine biosynthesis protein ThiS